MSFLITRICAEANEKNRLDIEAIICLKLNRSEIIKTRKLAAPCYLSK